MPYFHLFPFVFSEQYGEPDPQSDPETPFHDDKHEAKDQIQCEFLTHKFLQLLAVLLFLAYLQIVSAIPCLYIYILIHCDDDEVG